MTELMRYQAYGEVLAFLSPASPQLPEGLACPSVSASTPWRSLD